MRLLLIHNKYNSRLIGGEDVAFDQEYKILKERLGENLFVYEVTNDNISYFNLLFSFLFSFKHYKNVKNIIKLKSIDIVHIHNYFPQLTFSIFKAVKDCNVTLIHTLHSYRNWCITGNFYREHKGICELCTKSKYPISGVKFKCYKQSYLQSFFYQLSNYYNTYRNIYSKVDYFFVLTKHQEFKLISLGIPPEKMFIKPNFLEMDSYGIKPVREKKDFVFVGKMVEAKGLYYLLEIWKTLPHEFVLNIVGDGDDFKDLIKNYTLSNVYFHGKKSRFETLSIINKSKFLIQPSLMYETFGLTILESFYFSVPVIALAIGTRADFIDNGYNGFISSKEDFKELIYNAFYFEDYDNLAKGARSSYLKFGPDIIVNKQLEFYKLCIKDDFGE